MVDQGEQIESRADNATELSKKELKKMVAVLEELHSTNQEKRDQHKDEPLKYMDSEEALAAHLHEIQGLAAYPDRLSDCVDEGLLEGVLSVL